MSDKSLKAFDAAALADAAGAAPEPSAEAASSQETTGPVVSTDGAAPAAQTPPAVVTRAELLAILDEQSRKWQSLLDKRTAGLTRQLQAQQNAERALEAARASGVVIPPDKQADFLKALDKQGLLNGGNGQDDGAGQTQAAGARAEGADGDGLDPVTAQGQAIAEMYGLTGDDPEAANIQTDSPQAYLQSITLAGQQKLARLARAEHPNPARMPGLTPGGGPAKVDLSKKPRSALLQAEVRQAMKRG